MEGTSGRADIDIDEEVADTRDLAHADGEYMSGSTRTCHNGGRPRRTPKLRLEDWLERSSATTVWMRGQGSRQERNSYLCKLPTIGKQI